MGLDASRHDPAGLLDHPSTHRRSKTCTELAEVSSIENHLMHFDAFDRYHDTTSFIHRLDPRVKVVVTIAFILSNALLPDGAWIAFALSWLFLLTANMLSGLGLGYTFKRSFIALPFALVAITVLFSIPGKPIAA